MLKFAPGEAVRWRRRGRVGNAGRVMQQFARRAAARRASRDGTAVPPGLRTVDSPLASRRDPSPHAFLHA